MSSTRTSFLLLTSLIALVSYFLWPTLNLQYFFSYSDNAIHGLPLAYLHHAILNHGESALWTPLIYGGHPIFAESQGAFANPVNIVLNGAFEPVTVSILLHWLGMVMSVVGMFALCRALDLSPMASAFAALAAVFSPFWLTINNNAIVMAAVGWVPWTLWAFESWLKRPTLQTALRFGAITAMLLLSGYPHLLYVTAMYMATSLLPTLINHIKNAQSLTHLRALCWNGLLAVVVATGLVAVQLLPLLELIGQSHRGQGVKLEWFVFPILYERGLLFWTHDAAGSFLLYPLMSSTMVCMLAAAAVFLVPRSRIIGVALATLLLGNLGEGRASDIFNFIYTHNLLPGLNGFRITQPFFLPALIGISVLAAAAIDGAVRLLQFPPQSKRMWLTTACGVAAAALILAYAIHIHEAPISRLFLLTGAVTLLAPLLHALNGRASWLAPLLLVLLLTEIITIKLVKPNYQPTSLIKTPDIVEQIPLQKRRDYKFVDLADTAAALSLAPTSPIVPAWYRRMQTAVAPSSNLLWDVPSISGAFALNLTRQTLVEPHVRSEAFGQIQQAPGLRLIDLLGIRFVTAPAELQTTGFTLLRYDAEQSLYFYRNDFAMPRFQFYSNAIATKDVHSAFESLQHLQQRILVVEADPAELAAIGASTASAGGDSAITENGFSFVATRTQSDHYSFNTEATQGAWLFVADNMYPGWTATLDGKSVPLFAAQVMGKAVWVPVGKHQVEIRFESRSFQIGLAITLVTMATILVLLTVGRWSRKQTMWRAQTGKRTA